MSFESPENDSDYASPPEDTMKVEGTSTTISAEWRWIYGAIVVLAACLWLVSVAVTRTPDGELRLFFSPVIAYALLIALLRPFAGTSRHRTLVMALTVL